MKKIAIVAACVALMFYGCKPAKEKAQEQIVKAEKVLVDAKTKMIKPEQAALLVQAYVDYVNKYPEDSICPVYLYKAAEVSDGLGNPKQSVELYKQTHDLYPKWRKAPVALFMQAFTLDTRITDYFHAGQVYESFLAQYPEHQLAKDARFMLDNLGKTDAELLKAMSQRDSTSAK